MARPLRCLNEAPSDHVVRSLRERIDLLEEEIRQYREASENIATYPLAWKLTRKEAALLARLERAKGETVPKDNLLVALYGLEVDVEPKIIDVFVCKIRRKISGTGIEIKNNHGLGYRLTPESMAELRRLTATRQEAIAGIEGDQGSGVALDANALAARIAELEAENARLLVAVFPAPIVPPPAFELPPPSTPQRVRPNWREFVKPKQKHRAGAAPGLRLRRGGGDMTEAYYAPRKPATLKRQHECLAFAAKDHGLAFWSYIARYNDITAYQMKGWPDARPWMDLPEALTDGATTLAWLLEHEAEIRAFLALAPEARAAVVSHGPIVAELAQELAKREAIAKAGGPRR